MRYKLLISTLLFAMVSAGTAANEKTYPVDEKTGLVIDTGFDLVSTQCTICHNSELIKQNLQDRNTWKETIRWMQDTQNLWDLGENEPVMLDYLAKHYGIEGLTPPRRKNLPPRLMGIPETKEIKVAVATTTVASSQASQTHKEPQSGETVYKTVCFACHDAGIAGSPKFGDKAAWQPRIATGEAALVQSVLKGKGVMPPKGGHMALNEAEITNAVEYMMKAVKD